jgi:hypothetical protein
LVRTPLTRKIPEIGLSQHWQGLTRPAQLERSKKMDFQPWLNAAWDEEHRAGYHEAGHIEYARHVNANVSFTVIVDGLGGGRTALNLAGFALAECYAVAVAGCLAEAKGMGNQGAVEDDAPDHDVAQQIHDEFQPGDHAWQVNVMVGGNSEPSTSNGIDFEFLDGAAPNLAMLQTAVTEATAFLNNAPNWLRVRRRAWTLAIVKRPEI